MIWLLCYTTCMLRMYAFNCPYDAVNDTQAKTSDKAKGSTLNLE